MLRWRLSGAVATMLRMDGNTHDAGFEWMAEIGRLANELKAMTPEARLELLESIRLGGLAALDLEL